jgi:D-proline reductase (dithiol) PrdB
VQQGRIAELAPTVLTFMGGIYSARRVRDELAPRVAERMLAEEVDAALLVPV